jgi:ABC-type dipeptide/oligopeptide/nickel transport system ATPase component
VGGEPPDPGALPGGCAFHPRCPAIIAGICERIDPGLVEVLPSHFVACHLYPVGASLDTAGASFDATETPTTT